MHISPCSGAELAGGCKAACAGHVLLRGARSSCVEQTTRWTNHFALWKREQSFGSQIVAWSLWNHACAHAHEPAWLALHATAGLTSWPACDAGHASGPARAGCTMRTLNCCRLLAGCPETCKHAQRPRPPTVQASGSNGSRGCVRLWGCRWTRRTWNTVRPPACKVRARTKVDLRLARKQPGM